MSAKTLPLNNGRSIPVVGFGTWQDKDAQADAVCSAIKAGYRHIDTASVYGTEAACAEGIKRSGVPRSEIFLTTKLWNNRHHPDDVEKAIDESLRLLETDYVDLYLMHWPVAWGRGDKPRPEKDGQVIVEEIDYVDTYRAMEEKVLKTGKARSIGVSNFSLKEMERVLEGSSVPPAVHQIELHLYLQQKGFVEWHKQKGIVIEAYSPLANLNDFYTTTTKTQGNSGLPLLLEDQELVSVAKELGKTPAQVALAWGVSKGWVILPKSKTPARIEQNLDVFFEIPKQQMDKLDAMDKKTRFNQSSKRFGYNLFADLEGKIQDDHP